MKGMIFDIKGFSLNDGDGIRSTVFFKGCPLRCAWCHNPEGLLPLLELYIKKTGCVNCGLCKKPCDHKDCKGFSRCLHICPKGQVRVAGEEWDSEALSTHLLKNADLYKMSNGGITLSGGEPLMQAAFAIDLLKRIGVVGIHRALETSGFAEAKIFEEVICNTDFVYMDLKLADPKLHKKYTGVSNESILNNAEILQNSKIPHVFRIPLIPGITDGKDNLIALAGIVKNSKVELLPYNRFAPAKYESVGRKFPEYIEPVEHATVDISMFKNAVMKGQKTL